MLGKLNVNLQMAAGLKVALTILHPYTHQGLFNQTTFRPIQSGATVPLMPSVLLPDS